MTIQDLHEEDDTVVAAIRFIPSHKRVALTEAEIDRYFFPEEDDESVQARPETKRPWYDNRHPL